MEEIDIIELFKKIKEGNAPKEIEIDKTRYVFNDENKDEDLEMMYEVTYGCSSVYWLSDATITLDTKIKILDKPIIEELGKVIQKSVDDFMPPFEREPNCLELKDKINEIIRYINKENKE